GARTDDRQGPMRAYDGRSVADLDVREGGAGPEDDVVTDGAGAVDLGLRIDGDVSPEGHGGIDPRRGRVDHGDSGTHPALDDPAVELGAEAGQLDAVVDALCLPRVRDQVRAHPKALTAGDTEHVGEVLLALGVVRAHLAQRLAQDHGVEGIDAGVDLGDLQLRVGAVLLLDDAGDRAVDGAQDAPVAGGIRQGGGDHRGGAVAGGVRLEQGVQGLSCEQGNVAVGHQHSALKVWRQRLERTLGGPARALDLILVGDHGTRVDLGDVGGHQVTFVADHDGQVLRIDASRRGDRMA